MRRGGFLVLGAFRKLENGFVVCIYVYLDILDSKVYGCLFPPARDVQKKPLCSTQETDTWTDGSLYSTSMTIFIYPSIYLLIHVRTTSSSSQIHE